MQKLLIWRNLKVSDFSYKDEPQKLPCLHHYVVCMSTVEGLLKIHKSCELFLVQDIVLSWIVTSGTYNQTTPSLVNALSPFALSHLSPWGTIDLG
jgi:hypothetical protein